MKESAALLCDHTMRSACVQKESFIEVRVLQSLWLRVHGHRSHVPEDLRQVLRAQRRTAAHVVRHTRCLMQPAWSFLFAGQVCHLHLW